MKILTLTKVTFLNIFCLHAEPPCFAIILKYHCIRNMLKHRNILFSGDFHRANQLSGFFDMVWTVELKLLTMHLLHQFV